MDHMRILHINHHGGTVGVITTTKLGLYVHVPHSISKSCNQQDTSSAYVEPGALLNAITNKHAERFN